MDKQKQILNLLSPWALNTTMPVSGEARAQARETLLEVLEILSTPAKQAPARLNTLLATFNDLKVAPLELEHTNTALSNDDVKLYDEYFAIRHVHSNEQGLNLITSLLISLQRFYLLIDNLDEEKNSQVDLQLKGFQEHTHVLSRVLGLEPLQ